MGANLITASESPTNLLASVPAGRIKGAATAYGITFSTVFFMYLYPSLSSDEGL